MSLKRLCRLLIAAGSVASFLSLSPLAQAQAQNYPAGKPIKKPFLLQKALFLPLAVALLPL